MAHEGGRGIKKVQISVHMVYEWPLTMLEEKKTNEIIIWVNSWLKYRMKSFWNNAFENNYIQTYSSRLELIYRCIEAEKKLSS